MHILTLVIKGVKVLYMSPGSHILRLVKRIRDLQPDHYYFNSFFSYRFSILPLLLIKLRIVPSATILLAARGEFSPEALQ